MGIYAIKPQFQKVLLPVANLMIRHRVHPDTINAAGALISLSMAGAFFMVNKQPIAFWLLPLGAFFRTACNALDGMVARGLSVCSSMGEVKNELYDRISDSAIFLCIGLSGLADMRLCAGAVAALLINSYMGILGKSAGGNRVYKGIIGKADRMILVGVAGIVSFFFRLDLTWELTWNLVLVVVLVGSGIAMMQRLSITRKELS